MRFSDNRGFGSARMEFITLGLIGNFVAVAVIHCAARIHRIRGRSPAPEQKYSRVNISGRQLIVAAARHSGIRQFVFVSSMMRNRALTTGCGFQGSSSDAIDPSPNKELPNAKNELSANNCTRNSQTFNKLERGIGI